MKSQHSTPVTWEQISGICLALLFAVGLAVSVYLIYQTGYDDGVDEINVAKAFPFTKSTGI